MNTWLSSINSRCFYSVSQVWAFMFVVHTSNCHGQNCTRRAIYRLGIDTLIANILVIIIIIIIIIIIGGMLSSFCVCTLQMWKDYRLVWNMSDFEGLDVVYIHVTEMWTPDAMLHNKWVLYRMAQKVSHSPLWVEIRACTRVHDITSL